MRTVLPWLPPPSLPLPAPDWAAGEDSAEVQVVLVDPMAPRPLKVVLSKHWRSRLSTLVFGRLRAKCCGTLMTTQVVLHTCLDLPAYTQFSP